MRRAATCRRPSTRPPTMRVRSSPAWPPETQPPGSPSDPGRFSRWMVEDPGPMSRTSRDDWRAPTALLAVGSALVGFGAMWIVAGALIGVGCTMVLIGFLPESLFGALFYGAGLVAVASWPVLSAAVFMAWRRRHR
jgi:hypothetical protein